MTLKKELRTQGDFLFKHRSYLPVIIIIAGLAVYIQNEMTSDVLPHQQGEVYKFICLAVALLGLLIRVHAVGHAAKNTSGRNTTVGQVADEVNSTGLYSICRHPLYVGNFFMWLGIAGFTQEPWFIVAFTFMYWVYYERIMYAEEAFLTEKYGNKYADWASKTPAFIPAFSKWIKPQYSFSWPKIIKQEKTGIMNLFIVIFVFEAIGSYIRNGEILKMESYWWMLAVASIVWYIIIKVLQKTTKLFNV